MDFVKYMNPPHSATVGSPFSISSLMDCFETSLFASCSANSSGKPPPIYNPSASSGTGSFANGEKY